MTYLAEGKEEGHVGSDAFLLELLASLDALPRGGDLDVDAVLIEATGFVEVDKAASLCHSCLSIVGQTSITLRTNATWNNRKELLPNASSEAINSTYRSYRNSVDYNGKNLP